MYAIRSYYGPIAMGVAATLFAALPVYAEEATPDSAKAGEQAADTLLPTKPIASKTGAKDNIKVASDDEVNSFV